MKTSLFDYVLPDAAIARHPAPTRDGARLLVLAGDGPQHRRVIDLPELLPADALLVVNDTRVRKARLFGVRRPGGGRVELLFLAPLARHADGRERWSVLGRANRPLGLGTTVSAGPLEIEVLERAAEGLLEVAVASDEAVEVALERSGHVPIPPYLEREDEPDDVERYQTLFARRTASAAAPTAGLHFSRELVERCRERGVRVAALELEVGLGTFRPVAVDDLDRHPMHAENFEVSVGLAAEIARARERGAPVLAVGTTVVRALESAADPERPGHVLAARRATKLLIQPGYAFRVVDGLFTNFHQPRSTLLALVAAFVGRETLLAAYAEALASGYRFLSYGDAMWISSSGPPEGRPPQTVPSSGLPKADAAITRRLA